MMGGGAGRAARTRPAAMGRRRIRTATKSHSESQERECTFHSQASSGSVYHRPRFRETQRKPQLSASVDLLTTTQSPPVRNDTRALVGSDTKAQERAVTRDKSTPAGSRPDAASSDCTTSSFDIASIRKGQRLSALARSRSPFMRVAHAASSNASLVRRVPKRVVGSSCYQRSSKFVQGSGSDPRLHAGGGSETVGSRPSQHIFAQLS